MSRTPFRFTPIELALLDNLPEDNIIELAAELDLLIPEVISRRALLAGALDRLADLARREGLPMSRYDRDDLTDLPIDHLRALAKLCGTRPSVDALLKAGQKVYKVYMKRRPQSPVAMMLPMLLAPLARFAYENP